MSGPFVFLDHRGAPQPRRTRPRRRGSSYEPSSGGAWWTLAPELEAERVSAAALRAASETGDPPLPRRGCGALRLSKLLPRRFAPSVSACVSPPTFPVGLLHNCSLCAGDRQ